MQSESLLGTTNRIKFLAGSWSWHVMNIGVRSSWVDPMASCSWGGERVWQEKKCLMIDASELKATINSVNQSTIDVESNKSKIKKTLNAIIQQSIICEESQSILNPDEGVVTLAVLRDGGRLLDDCLMPIYRLLWVLHQTRGGDKMVLKVWYENMRGCFLLNLFYLKHEIVKFLGSMCLSVAGCWVPKSWPCEVTFLLFVHCRWCRSINWQLH